MKPVFNIVYIQSIFVNIGIVLYLSSLRHQGLKTLFCMIKGKAWYFCMNVYYCNQSLLHRVILKYKCNSSDSWKKSYCLQTTDTGKHQKYVGFKHFIKEFREGSKEAIRPVPVSSDKDKYL